MTKKIVLKYPKTPIIHTPNLTLKTPSIKHAKDLLQIFEQKESMAQIPLVTPTNLEQTRVWIKNAYRKITLGKAQAWYIYQKNTNKLIGNIVLKNIDYQNGSAEIGYMFHNSYWGKGYATEAGKVVCHFGFNELKLHRIEALTNPKNINSQKVLQKLHFSLEGTLRHKVNFNNSFYDMLIFSRLATD